MRDDIVTEIKQRLPIEQYIQKYISLRRNGARLLGLCPFHQEKTPSFTVNVLSGFFHCFGCHASGDIFTFAERYHGMEFKEVLYLLAEEVGLNLKELSRSTGAHASVKQNLFSIYTIAHKHFISNLHSSTSSMHLDYFRERGLSLETIHNFALGYSLPSWSAMVELLRRSGFSKDIIATSGLVHTKHDRCYDAFRDRYMFPIMTTGGGVVAFGGRVNPLSENKEQAKYINSPETPIYTKGKILYGLQQARKQITIDKSIMITEGYFDVITLHQHGYTTAVAVLGTALTKEHAKTITSFASTVELVFDADTAGNKATLSASRLLLTEGIRVRVITLPQGEDVDSFLRSFGKEAFEEQRMLAKDGLDFCIDYVRTLSPKEISVWVQSFIKEIQDPLLLAQYTKKLALGFGLTEQSIYSTGTYAEDSESHSDMPTSTQKLSEKEYTILKHLITYPHNISTIHNAGLDFVLHSQEASDIAHALCTHTDNYQAAYAMLNAQTQSLFAELLVDIAPSEKEELELQDILRFLEKEYIYRNTISATTLLRGSNDIEGLSRIQNIIHSHVHSTE